MIIDSKLLQPRLSPQAVATILTVEPDEEYRSGLRLCLQDNGFAVVEIADGAEVFAELDKKCIDLLIMEYYLPGIDSANFVREICARYDVPVILTSQRARVIQRIIGLEMGADDFLTRPFELDELVARVRVVLRRMRRKRGSFAPVEAAASARSKLLYRFDNLMFDVGRRELRSAEGSMIELTSMEIDLLFTFVQNPQRPLSRVSIIESLGKGGDGAAVRTIDVLVSKLRKKLEDGHRDADIIKTVRGAGYVFTPDVFQEGSHGISDAR
jgi:two-component system, OmpR family, response regulator